MILLRMDCDAYPMYDFEKQLFMDAGITKIIEIEGFDKNEIIGADPDVIAVVSGFIPEDVIAQLHHCKIILRMGTGYDKIAMDAATQRGIMVTIVPDYCVHEVAEHDILLMLAAARKLPELTHTMEDGTWMEVRKNASIQRLHGKTLGIIGFGRIGREVGKIASAIGMKIIVNDVFQNAVVDYPFEYVLLEGLLKESDFISINCPLIKETAGMIGEKEFALMKKSAVIINVARGAICDENALARALKSHQIAYAGIDVHEHINVFAPAVQPYKGVYDGIPNIITTPHYASISKEAWRECVEKSIAQLKAFIEHEIPKNCVNCSAIK